MNKIKLLICSILLSIGIITTANAAPIYVQVDNGLGDATLDYFDGTSTKPVFNFNYTSGTVSQNLTSFLPSNYTATLSIVNLEFDINENGNWLSLNTLLDPADTSPFTESITSPSAYLSSLPPFSGMSGPLNWNLDLSSTIIMLSYDFDVISGPNSNSSVNNNLATADFFLNGSSDGELSTDVRWDSFRVELNKVPEPATVLLIGLGILGFAGNKRTT